MPEAPGVERMQEEMRPPAAVSAMETVSPRDLRREVISERMGRRAAGGKSVDGVGVDIVWVTA